ncbi:MAG: FoF1 ATP synthase subunit delta/epsilon [Phycisphaerales bacterium]
MAKTFHCTLITPTAKVLDDEVAYASVPAWDGLFGVLADHAPIVAKVGLGELRLDFPARSGAPGGSRAFLVEDGFVQVVHNKMTILAGRAIPTETLSASEAEAELREAEARIVPDGAPDRNTQSERLSKDRNRARLKVRLARERKGI